jgi:predicted nucleotide-binding protein
VKIFVIEDDQFYAQKLAELLRDHGAEAILIQSAEDALQADMAEVTGAIVDLMLPNNPDRSGISNEESRGGFLTGVCIARRFLERNPNLRLVLLTSAFNPEADAWARSKQLPVVSKSEGYLALLRCLQKLDMVSGENTPLAFIVHGHDQRTLLELKDYLQNVLKWQPPIVLRDQPNGGRTIIEKFEDYAHRVDCIFVLLTPDDTGRALTTDDEKRRSRQNVIFEAGFFYGSLGRLSGRIVLLYKGAVELPSDISGVVWIDISNGIASAGEEIRRDVEPIMRGLRLA